jgi:integrase
MARQPKPHPWTDYGPQPISVELIRSLAKAAPPDRPREIRDRAAGLILRHQPTGQLSVYANLGRAKRERLCDARRIIDSSSTWTLGKAKADANRLRVEYADGRDFAAERKTERAIPTLKRYLEDTFGPWVKQNRRSGASTLARIESCFEDDFGNAKLTELTPAKLEPWRARRQRKGVKPETINRDINALRGALSRAVKLGVISTNPLIGIEPAEVDRHKRVVRALTAAEKENVIAALRARDDRKREQRVTANLWRDERGRDLLPAIGTYADVLTPAVIMSLETGLRRHELFSAQWTAIDLDEKTLRVEGATAKTLETRDIPLNDIAYRTLRDWWLQCGQPKTGLVFALNGKPIGSLKTSYHAILKAAGIERVNAKGERVNWHSLRHTFGSLLGAASVDPTTLMKLMGHADLSTTQRYLHTDEDRKRAAVEALQKSE